MQKMTQLLPLLRGQIIKRKGVPQGIRKHSILRGAFNPLTEAAQEGHNVAVDPPTDQKEILDMLVQPQTFGQGLFDYSCHGNNWIISDKVLNQQSPINFSPKEMTEYAEQFNVELKYKTERDLHMENILWTVRLQGGDLGGIEVTDLNGQGPYVYKVNHMHMHGPAEHRLDNVQYDLEVHIVHELVDGPEKEHYKETLAVIGFFFQISDKSHPFIEKLRPHDFGKIDQISFNELFQTLSAENNAAQQELTNTKNRFYHYKGGLTNPPCADVVNWILYKQVLPITAEDLHAFKSIWMKNLGYGNYRDCQPLCGRKIVRNFERFEDEEQHVHSHACGHSHNERHHVHHI